MADMTLQMPDGSSRTITVDDAIKTMAPEQQAAFAAHARATIAAQTQQPATPSPSGPAAAPGPAPQDTSYAADLGSGLHGLEHSARATARLADLLPDGTPGKAAISGFGHGQQVLPEPANYTPASSKMTEALRGGHYGEALSQLPHAAVQELPGMIPGIAAGAVGGPVAAAGVIAAQNAGENVEARQAANGNATPSTGDVVGGLATSAVQGGLGAIGLKPAAIPGVGQAIGRLPTLARAGIDVASEAVAGGANDAIGQAGTTVGTTKGLTIDPAEVASAAAQGGAARLATVVPGQAKSGVRALGDEAMMSRMEKPASLEDAKAIATARDLTAKAQEDAKATKGDTSLPTAANNAKSEVRSNLNTVIDQLRADEHITPMQARAAKALINDQALRSNNTIAEGDQTSSLFDRLNELDIPDSAVDTLKSGVRVLDALSTQSFQKNQVGPFQQVGKFLGNAGALVAAGATMDPYAVVGALAGHAATGKLGGMVGLGIDKALGTATPAVMLRGKLADRMLKAEGAEPGGNPIADLQNLSGALDDASPLPDAALRRAKLAQVLSDQADRAAVGNPVRDPVPVNTALPGAPQTAPEASPAAPSPAPVVPQPPSPQKPLAAPPGPSGGDWRSYASHGRGHTAAEIHDAVYAAAEAGHMTPEEADAMVAHQGRLPPDQIAKVQRFLPDTRIGLPGEHATGLPGGTGYRGRIIDPQKYQMAIDQAADHADAKMALAGDDMPLKAAILNIRHTASGAQKAALAKAYLDDLAHTGAPEARIAQAKALLSGPLMESKVP